MAVIEPTTSQIFLHDHTSLAKRKLVVVNGNVGIGTTSPGYNLDIGPVAAQHATLRLNPPANYGGYIYFGTAATPAYIYSSGNAGDFRVNVNAADVFTAVSTGATANTLYLKAGNVGIGTTAPGAALHTLGTGNTFNRVETSAVGDNYSGFDIKTPSGTWGVYSGAAGNAIAGKLGFFNGTYKMVIDTAGNVGIGTTVPTSKLHLAAGSATAGTAPLGFTSGTLLTTAVVGKVEFLTDDYFATITTGAARKAFILDDGTRLTSGKVPVATTNGRLIDSAGASGSFTTVDLKTVTVTNGLITSIV